MEILPLSKQDDDSAKNSKIPACLQEYDTIRTSVAEMVARFPLQLWKQDIEVIGQLFCYNRMYQSDAMRLSQEDEISGLIIEKLKQYVNQVGKNGDDLDGDYIVNSIKQTLTDTLPLDLISSLEKVVHATITNTETPTVMT